MRQQQQQSWSFRLGRWMRFMIANLGIASLPATAASLDGIRGDVIKAAEARLAACNIKGYDASDMPTPLPIPDAERNYFRRVVYHGSERFDVVGHFQRNTVRFQDFAVNYRAFLSPQGAVVAFLTDSGINYLSFSTPRHGVVANINAFRTLDRFGRPLHDFNGHCQYDYFTGLVQNNLYNTLVRCIDEVWGKEVADTLCAQRRQP